jgi:hypothetical protein
MAIYYIDTCIWRDYLEDRRNKFSPLGEWAGRLFNEIIEEKSIVTITGLLLKELKLDKSEIDNKEFLNPIPKNLLFFLEASKDLAIAISYSIPKNDALHFVIAKDDDAILAS